MKIVQINNTLRIKNSDRLNWTIEELKIAPDTLKNGKPNPKAGEETWKGCGHYPKLEHACKRCFDLMLSDPPDRAVTLEEVRLEILTAQSAIIEAIANAAEKEGENKKELITEAAE